MDIQPPGPLIQSFATSWVRHIMSGAGAYLAAKGAIQATQSAEFVEMGTGIVIWGAALGWSQWQKYGAARVLMIISKLHPVVPHDATMDEAVRVATAVADAGPA